MFAKMWQNYSMKAAGILTKSQINAINATCPACGLLCDDIQLGNNDNKITVLTKNCAKAVHFFEQPLADATPLINGKPASLEQAILHATKLIKASQQPLFTGLGTDVAGFRSIYNLAQETNGSMQHANAKSMARNIKVLQSTGWQTTTLTEVKNRADVIVCFGDVAAHNPRFFERFVDCDGMFVKAKNRQVIIFNSVQNSHNIKSNALKGAWILPCRADDLPSLTIALRALVAGKALKATEVAGLKLSDLQIVAEKLLAAKYAVLAWVAKDFDYNHAELSIQNITETVAILNNSTRAAGLPLGGSDGDTTANNANTWLSGFALNDDDFTVQSNYDLQININSFNAETTLDKFNKPLIIFGNNNIENKHLADVFISIATPGLDCSGTLFRVDSAIVLPLKKVRGSSLNTKDLPTLAEMVSEIEKLL